jgi:tetratricopeptide (TPR) repeat protein
VQDTAYQSLLKSRRQELHGRIAETLEERFPERAAAEPEVLAHHFEDAGLAAEAIAYYERAGRRASERSANAEAIEQLSRGIELLRMLPEGSVRDGRELRLQLAIGASLHTVKGHGSRDVERTYDRALVLCREVGDESQLFQALSGLSVFYRNTEVTRAIEVGTELLALAELGGETVQLLHAHSTLGNPLYHHGLLSKALEHHDRAIELYDPIEHRSLVYAYGLDPGISSLVLSSWILWQLGYPERALERGEQAIGLAREAAHPFSLATALFSMGLGDLRRGEPRSALERAEESIAISKEQDFWARFSLGDMLINLALSRIADPEEARRAIDKVPESLDRVRAMPLTAGSWGLLADSQRGLDRAEDALRSVNTGLALSAERHAPFWDAELHRLKGEIFLQLPDHEEEDAEALFRTAIDIARDQEARSLELRAATSLARLGQCQGKRAEARALLAPVYDWFTEGFDTKDLKAAKVLLDELA